MVQVSVIMSTYNRAQLLKQAVNSVLEQTFSDFEFIIIDDNSSDNTFEILKSFNDKRLKIFKNKQNAGCTFNYHNAQNLAEAELIAHIDDDDVWMCEKLEKQLEFMKNNQDISLSGCFMETFGENARPSWVFDTDSSKLAFMMNFYNPLCHSAVIYRKSFMLKNGINYDLSKKCAQDYDFYKQIIIRGGKIANIPEMLVKYRMHPKRLTDIKETQNIQIDNAENIKKELLSRFLNGGETEKITELVKGFPFNEYNTDNVIKAAEYSGQKYCEKFKISKSVIESAVRDIQNGRYRF